MADLTHYQRDIRAVPAWLVVQYLVDLGGSARDTQTVVGDDWTGHVTPRPDHQIGSLRVGEVRLTVTGSPDVVAGLAQALDQRLNTRGGG